MKLIKKLACFILALLLSAGIVTAQNDQLERDIRIAEGILGEIFSDDEESNFFRPISAKRVQSEYIPGYGVHFKVGTTSSFGVFAAGAIRNIHVARGEGGNVRIETNEKAPDDNGEESREEIIAKMLDYLINYSASIRGLPENEHLRISYGIGSHSPNVFINFFAQDDSSKNKEEIKLTMWVSGSDLQQYRNGNLSKEQYENRINHSDIPENSEMRDMNIFASVVETAVNSAELNKLRVNRKPTFEYLPGLGAHFQVNVSAGTSPIFGLKSSPNIQLNIGEALDMSEGVRFITPHEIMIDSIRVHTEQIRKETEEIIKQAEQIRVQGDSIRNAMVLNFNSTAADTIDLSGEKEMLLKQISDVISDYGSTLTSLSDDELLMITVNWSGRNTTLPERTHIRIKKSDLLRGDEPETEEIWRR